MGDSFGLLTKIPPVLWLIEPWILYYVGYIHPSTSSLTNATEPPLTRPSTYISAFPYILPATHNNSSLCFLFRDLIDTILVRKFSYKLLQRAENATVQYRKTVFSCLPISFNIAFILPPLTRIMSLHYSLYNSIGPPDSGAKRESTSSHFNDFSTSSHLPDLNGSNFLSSASHDLHSSLSTSRG